MSESRPVRSLFCALLGLTGVAGALVTMAPAATSQVATDTDWAVRTAVYSAFATDGQPPSLAALASSVGLPEDRVRTALRRLYDAHEIAPLDGADGVWMANPFSGVPTDYPVETPDFTCYSNCAWDALGVPAERVRVLEPTTEQVPDSGPTVASRTCMIVGKVVERAAAAMRDRLRTYAAAAGLDPGDLSAAAAHHHAHHGEAAETATHVSPPSCDSSLVHKNESSVKSEKMIR